MDASGLLSARILEGLCEEVGEVTHVAEPWKRYWDDISGKELIPELVQAARQEELKVVDEMGVWEVRPLAECLEVIGMKPTKVRWVDGNKGDSESPNVRSRSRRISRLMRGLIYSRPHRPWSTCGIWSRGVLHHS